MPRARGAASKHFFFCKKRSKKTFIPLMDLSGKITPKFERFFASFFTKKEVLAYFTTRNVTTSTSRCAGRLGSIGSTAVTP